MSQSILNLNQGTPTTASQIPYYDPNCGQDRRCSVSDLLALFASGASGPTTVYASPNASGYTVSLTAIMNTMIPLGTSLWVLITPLAGYAAMTLALPIGVNGQEIVVNCTQSVTALTVSGAVVGVSPQPVNGAPTTLAANGHFRLKFDGVTGAWYAI
jgi:hypothetical protein